MASIPNPQPGDWLQHEAFRHYRFKKAKIAEVVSLSAKSVTLCLNGEPGRQVVSRAEITRWWNVFEPKPDPEALEPPVWVQAGKFFQVPDHQALIYTVRDSWVSYMEDCKEYRDVFRIMPYRDFTTAGWQPLRKVSVWELIRMRLV